EKYYGALCALNASTYGVRAKTSKFNFRTTGALYSALAMNSELRTTSFGNNT
ncbi:unnamed protein product, partial [Musa hybrid cultivar]